ncbi:MAG: glycosyltransferase [Thermofilum sp.]|uniref:glycosyltransferase n=1 Tax=Thermoprotei TaxID=183924 RepID=UPI003168D46D
MHSISVVVVNRNGEKFLDKLFKSLLDSLIYVANFYPHVNFVEVIFIDNASTDSSLKKAHYWRIVFNNNGIVFRIVPLRRNYGYTFAASCGVVLARGSYVAILNPDLYVDRDWLVHILNTFMKYRRVGIVQPLILDYKDPSITQSKGLFCDEVYNYKGNVFNSQIILAPFGAAYIARRDILMKIGLLDSLFFMYGDEVDLGLRVWRYGYIVLLDPNARVYHFGGGVTPQEIALIKRYLGLRNQLITLIKSCDGITCAIKFVILLGINVVRCLRSLHTCRAILSAYAYLIKRLKVLHRRRLCLSASKLLKESSLRKMGLIRPVLE